MRVWDDIRYGARMLARNRSVTIVGALTLALGIGVNTAIFSTLAAYFWTPLPYPEPDRLIFVNSANTNMGWTEVPVSYADGLDFRRAGNLQAVALYRTTSVALSGAGEPQNIFALNATPEIFDVLQVSAVMGRTFDEAEQGPGEHRVAVIGDALWRRQFGGDPKVLGSEIRLDGKNFTVIGVLPPDFHFLYGRSEVFVPLVVPPERAHQRDYRFLRTIGRLKPGATLDQADAQVRSIASGIEQNHPATHRGWTAGVRPAHEIVVPRGARVSISTMYYAVNFVLLIACVNIASLLLSRGTLRAKELAIRASLGAGRSSIVRLLLTESLMLGMAGGLLGIGFAYAAMPALQSIAPPDLRRPEMLVVDGRGLAYGFGVCVISGLFAGLLPALTMSRAGLAPVLRAAGRGSTAGRHHTLRALVVVEVMMSVVLLAAGGLLVKSMVGQLSASPGFEKSNLMTATVRLPESLYPQPHQAGDFFRAVTQSLRADSRVVNAAAVQTVPLGNASTWTPVIVEGAELPVDRDRQMVGHMVATDGYFDTLGIPILAGRGFTTHDGPSAPKVAVVNQTMANRYWPQDPRPLGRRIKLGTDKSDWLTVVGIAKDVRHHGATQPARPEAYQPHSQAPERSMVLVVRTNGDPHPVAPLIRTAVLAADRNQPLFNLETLEELMERRMAGPLATAQVMGFLAVLALVLACVGIYGVVSYMASQRAREIGIRLALGAARGGIFVMVLRSGLLMAAIGLVAGFGAAAGITPLLRFILNGIEPHDTATFALTGGVLLAVAIVATTAPAWRAMRLDPIQVLREE